jgi:ribosomal protein L29
MAKRQSMKTLGDAELAKVLADTRKELFGHRLAAAGSRPKDTNVLKKSRRTVARVLTEMRARQKTA